MSKRSLVLLSLVIVVTVLAGCKITFLNSAKVTDETSMTIVNTTTNKEVDKNSSAKNQAETTMETTAETTVRPKGYPVEDYIVKKALPNVQRMTIEEFDKLYKEKGEDYWKGKSVVIEAFLSLKPDIILHKGVAGERVDTPSAAVSATQEQDGMFIGFFISRDVNNYLIENVEIGEPVLIEFDNITDLKTYDQSSYLGYHINVERQGPKVIDPNYEYPIDEPTYGPNHPMGNRIVKEALPSLNHLTIEEFDKICKEKGEDYWIGKNVVIEAILASRPELTIPNGEAIEGIDHTLASVTATQDNNSMLISFLVSPDISTYLIEHINIGTPVAIEFNNIGEIQTYDATNYNGYHINLKSTNGYIFGPNIIDPNLKNGNDAVHYR